MPSMRRGSLHATQPAGEGAGMFWRIRPFSKISSPTRRAEGPRPNQVRAGINAQTARMLGLTVRDKLLVAAEEVIGRPSQPRGGGAGCASDKLVDLLAKGRSFKRRDIGSTTIPLALAVLVIGIGMIGLRMGHWSCYWPNGTPAESRAPPVARSISRWCAGDRQDIE